MSLQRLIAFYSICFNIFMPIWITYVIVLHYPHKPMDLTNHIPSPFNYQNYYLQVTTMVWRYHTLSHYHHTGYQHSMHHPTSPLHWHRALNLTPPCHRYRSQCGCRTSYLPTFSGTYQKLDLQWREGWS